MAFGCTRPVLIPQTCSVPFFGDSLQYEFRRFRFRAGVIHLGQSPSSGHYRTVLAQPDGLCILLTTASQLCVCDSESGGVDPVQFVSVSIY